MLRDVRRLHVPELDAAHAQVDLRTPSLRVGLHEGRNVASDFALVERAAPFVHHLVRPQLVVLFEGTLRYDERGERRWVQPGSLALTDAQRGGTDAFAGERTRWLVLDWDPGVMGQSFGDAASIGALDPRDLARLDAAARELRGPEPHRAVVEIVRVLRAMGLGLSSIDARALASPTPHEQRAQELLAAQLSDLRRFPAITDLASALGTGERQANRRIEGLARRFRYPWPHWRAALHHTRLITALRLLAAPGATTERVALAAGFRAPSALCHAFERGGLPSPGVLAKTIAREGLDGWGSIPSPSERASTRAVPCEPCDARSSWH